MEVTVVSGAKIKERIIDKVLKLPEKEVEKLSIFLSGLEVGKSLLPIQESVKQTKESA